MSRALSRQIDGVLAQIDEQNRLVTRAIALLGEIAATIGNEFDTKVLQQLDDIRAAIALLEEQTNVDAQPPIVARNWGVAAAKKTVRKAVFFALDHITEQMRALGWATTSVGKAAAERIEQLEARVLELERRLVRPEAGGASGDPGES